ncbi:hypothetical protein FHT71_003662 [Rhizobium sp. BK060]|nr:hypothetical protein [Rhizobium sp. BK060]
MKMSLGSSNEHLALLTMIEWRLNGQLLKGSLPAPPLKNL